VVTAPIWVIRGGDDNRYVDRFLDGGYTAVAYPEVGDGRKLERHLILRALERAEVKDPPAAANAFHAFASAISVGDAVLMPDVGRKQVVIGIVEGDYEFHEDVAPSAFRHRRPVRWLRRHDRDELPPSWDELYKQRSTLKRYEAQSLSDHVARVVAGEIGRDAKQRTVARVRTTSSTGASTSRPRAPRAPAKPKAPERKLRTCPSCGFNLNEAVFEGHELCRDCR
jgi:predicted Mrr-cat superfamily restriction endonuclease